MTRDNDRVGRLKGHSVLQGGQDNTGNLCPSGRKARVNGTTGDKLVAGSIWGQDQAAAKVISLCMKNEWRVYGDLQTVQNMYVLCKGGLYRMGAAKDKDDLACRGVDREIALDVRKKAAVIMLSV